MNQKRLCNPQDTQVLFNLKSHQMKNMYAKTKRMSRRLNEISINMVGLHLLSGEVARCKRLEVADALGSMRRQLDDLIEGLKETDIK